LSGIPYDEYQALFRLGLVSLLFIMILVLSRRRRLGIDREFGIALIVGGSQLAVVAVLLTLIFVSPLWPLWTLLLLPAMIFIGGRASARRASDMPDPAIITTPSIALGSGVVLGFLFLTGAIPPAPQFIIPLAGMAIGNSMIICSLTLDRLIREARMNRALLEASLALGASSAQSIAPYEELSIRSALIPTLDSLKTLGIIFIPGAMTGLILAGTSPIVAAEYQIIVYFMIVGGGIISSMTVATLARKRLFTPACQVEAWI